MAELVEKAVIWACLKGDENAFRKMYESCAPYVFSIVKNYFNDVEDRKDAMQEIFANIIVSLKNFDEKKGELKSWLSRLVVYQCISLIKKSNGLKVIYNTEIEEEAENNTLISLERLTSDDLEKMLELMPKGYKTVFLLSVIEEYSHKEIGEMLGITPETSRSQLLRSIKWIKSNILTKAKMVQYGLY